MTLNDLSVALSLIIPFVENKFAVGSGGRAIALCYFVSENDWWQCKHIKRTLRSTVTTVDWHPDNKVLVAGSTDYRVRVFSAFISNMEDAPESSPWGQSNTLGTLLAEFQNTPNGGKKRLFLSNSFDVYLLIVYFLVPRRVDTSRCV